MATTYVTSTALMTCTFGIATCPLMVNPSRTVFVSGQQRANISDFAPMTNIPSFGMCSSPSNPAVIAATAAAMGVFTPAPCIPAIVSPWMPGKPDLLVQNMPALTKNCRNTCMWMGQISFVNDGQIPLPPPVTTPPVGKLSCVPAGDRKSLTYEELGKLPVKVLDQYQKDLATAQDVGAFEEMMAKAWEKTVHDYTQKGEEEKAMFAIKKMEGALAAGNDKRNLAIGNVNQKYRNTLSNNDNKTGE